MSRCRPAWPTPAEKADRDLGCFTHSRADVQGRNPSTGVGLLMINKRAGSGKQQGTARAPQASRSWPASQSSGEPFRSHHSLKHGHALASIRLSALSSPFRSLSVPNHTIPSAAALRCLVYSHMGCASRIESPLIAKAAERSGKRGGREGETQTGSRQQQTTAETQPNPTSAQLAPTERG